MTREIERNSCCQNTIMIIFTNPSARAGYDTRSEYYNDEDDENQAQYSMLKFCVHMFAGAGDTDELINNNPVGWGC